METNNVPTNEPVGLQSEELESIQHIVNNLDQNQNQASITDILRQVAQQARQQTSNNAVANANIPAQNRASHTNNNNANLQTRMPLLRFISLLNTWRKSCVFFIIYFIPVILVAFPVSIVYWNDCENPLGPWLLTLSLLHAAQLGLTIRTYLGLPTTDDPLRMQETGVRKVFPYYIATRILDFVWFLWFTQGGAWTFTTSCDTEGSALYKTCLAFFILHCAMVLFIASMCCFTCCGLLYDAVRSSGGNVPIGASKSLIKKLKVSKFKVGDIAKEDATCAVCLGDYEDNNEIRYLPCNHHFHSECVDQWLQLNKTCPLCKKDISERNQDV